jgi:DNA-directed RNA polymerase sigma subunit (sigma70/sigma32)
MDITGVRGASKFMSIEDIFTRIQAIEETIRDGERMLKLLTKQLSDINILLYNLEGRQYKIFWKHKCENKSFQEIANEIGMSAKQVQRIYKEVTGDE